MPPAISNNVRRGDRRPGPPGAGDSAPGTAVRAITVAFRLADGTLGGAGRAAAFVFAAITGRVGDPR